MSTDHCNQLISVGVCAERGATVAVRMMSSPVADFDLSMASSGTYRIVVGGQVHGLWAPGLGRMIISERIGRNGRPESILVGCLPNQGALMGVLLSLHDLQVPLLSLEFLHSD